MKTLVFGLLVLVSVAVASSDLQSAVTILSRHVSQYHAALRIDAASLALPPHQEGTRGRAFNVAASKDDCRQCRDASFRALFEVINACGSAFDALDAAVGNATSDSGVDTAWSTFCNSTCYNAIDQVQPKHYCCLGASGAAVRHLREHACRRSGEGPGRRCGAEVSNIAKASKCKGVNATTCAASGLSCAWLADSSTCVFKPTNAALAHICTQCNRAFMQTMPSGGYHKGKAFAGIAAGFQTMCLMVDGARCLAIYDELGYPTAATADGPALEAVCRNHTAKRCVRALAAVTAEGMRQAARTAFQQCDPSSGRDAACRTAFVEAQRDAAAFEGVTSAMCAQRNGSRCFPLVRGILNGTAGACLRDAFAFRRCNASCEQPIAQAAAAMGCCGPVVGRAGYFAVAHLRRPVPVQLFLSVNSLDAFVNYSGPVKSGERAPMSDDDAEALERKAVAEREGPESNSFSALKNCTSVAYDAWASNASACGRPRTRTYHFVLRLRFEKLLRSKATRELRQRLVQDLCIALGITPEMVRNAAFKANKDNLPIGGAAFSGTTLVLTVDGDDDADNAATDAILARLALLPSAPTTAPATTAAPTTMAPMTTTAAPKEESGATRSLFLMDSVSGIATPNFGAFATANCDDCLLDEYSAVVESASVVYAPGDTPPPPSVVTSGAANFAQAPLLSAVVLLLALFVDV